VVRGAPVKGKPRTGARSAPEDSAIGIICHRMSAPLPELPGVEHEFHALSTGVRVHVAVAGPSGAPPLLALHGWPQHWYCWRRIVPLLAGDFRLLMPDLRGLGWSGAPRDGDYRKERLADDALALLDALGIERAGLLGHDWGGWAGFLAVLRAPGRFTGYVAQGIPHPWTRPSLQAIPRLAYQPPIATPFLGPRLIRDTPLVATMHRAAWGERSTFDPAAVEVFAAVYRDPARAEASSRYYRDFLTRELPGRLRGSRGRLTVPTRLLFGVRDPLGADLAKGLERHGDHARVELLEGCGHFVPEERPESVASAVREVCG
jgi:pimeloyl-ACP methyl ester carboxylesterase